MTSDDWKIPQRTYEQMERVDAMPADLRSCVHEFSCPIVRTCVDLGIKNPQHIRALVSTIWDGARQPQNAANFRQSSVMMHLDWLLSQAGAQINAARLVRFLHGHHWVMVPLHANAAMVNASMATISEFNERITKQEKHKRRLIAALDAGSKSLFPHLYTNEQLQAKKETAA